MVEGGEETKVKIIEFEDQKMTTIIIKKEALAKQAVVDPEDFEQRPMVKFDLSDRGESKEAVVQESTSSGQVGKDVNGTAVQAQKKKQKPDDLGMP